MHLDKLAREAKADELFLSGLGQIIQQGRDAISGNKSRDYGPTLIAGLTQVKAAGFRKKDLETAMDRLLEANKIHIGKIAGPPAKQKKCIRPGAKP